MSRYVITVTYDGPDGVDVDPHQLSRQLSRHVGACLRLAHAPSPPIPTPFSYVVEALSPAAEARFAQLTASEEITPDNLERKDAQRRKLIERRNSMDSPLNPDEEQELATLQQKFCDYLFGGYPVSQLPLSNSGHRSMPASVQSKPSTPSGGVEDNVANEPESATWAQDAIDKAEARSQRRIELGCRFFDGDLDAEEMLEFKQLHLDTIQEFKRVYPGRSTQRLEHYMRVEYDQQDNESYVEQLERVFKKIAPKPRRPADVLLARETPAGCCEDYANNNACDCMNAAREYEALLRKRTRKQE